MNMKFKTVICKSICVGLSLLLTTSIVFAQTAEKKEIKCPRIVKVLVGEIVGDTFLEYRDLEKIILPDKTDRFTSPMPGGIKKIETDVGSDVKTGDVLMVIDDAPIKKEIADAKVMITRWQRILRKRENWAVRSPAAERQAKRNIKKYEDLIAKKQEELGKIIIKSPVDGRIETLTVKEGDHISEDFVLGTIVNIDQVKILLDQYTDKVNIGQKININLKELSQTVEGVVQKADDGSTYIVIPNSDKKILHGMNAYFRILFKEHKDVVVLTGEQFFKDDSGAFVYIVKGKYAKKSYLKTGPVEKGRVLILDGLSIGDEMIISEVLSAKEATLKEKLTCVKDNKKISIVIMDDVKGKFVKRKKHVKPVPVKEVKEEIREKEIPVKKVEPTPVKVKEKKPAPKIKKEEVEKPAVPKTPKVEKKVVPLEEEYRKIDAFIDYLNNNKSTLKYEKFRVRTMDGMMVVVVYCNAICRDKLIPVIHKFNVEKYFVSELKPDRYQIETYFREAKRAWPKITRVPRVPRAPRKYRPGAPLPKLRIGASLGDFLMFDTIFKEVYGNMVGLGLDISYTISEKLDIWAYAGTSSKTAEIDLFEEDLKFTFTPITLDLRYFFKRDQKWDFFGGAGINIYPFKDENPIEEVKDNAVGINLLAGTYYHITEKFLLHLAVRFNIVKKSIENADNDLNMNSTELLLGFSYNL
ncbi:MAG: HlyD family efflux transporter periplasmic adaptor subunit [Candidatus Aminicenantes bacterium]|nr:MAG: HlyD family efflux transporter periplasmic adaptor subunit [Candidatus Aminicenantes bacterium]